MPATAVATRATSVQWARILSSMSYLSHRSWHSCSLGMKACLWGKSSSGVVARGEKIQVDSWPFPVRVEVMFCMEK